MMSPIDENQRNDWALSLMEKGVIVRLKISWWKGVSKLTRDDLGIRSRGAETDEFINDFLKLGHQKIFPPEVISEVSILERRARDNLRDYSFDTFWGRFVPYTAFDPWHKQNEKTKKAFKEKSLDIANHHENIVTSVESSYRIFAKDAWRRIHGVDAGDPTEAFAHDFVNKVVQKIPSQTDIVGSFSYDSVYLSIPMPELLSSTDGAHKCIVDEYSKRKGELIGGFIHSTVDQLRGSLAVTFSDVIKSIRKRSHGSGLNKNHIDKINGMIRQGNLMNFYNDNITKALLSDLRSEVNKRANERNDDLIVAKLEDIVEASKQLFIP